MFQPHSADKYTKLNYDGRTGQMNRQWLKYADGTFEPVRKGQYVSRKQRDPDPAKDWWVTEKPRDWDPAEHGHKVSLNHKPGEKQPTAGQPGKSTLGKGAEGFWEMQARDKARQEQPTIKTSAQNAQDLKVWEKQQGIDPDLTSSHEKRPPSSSRDASLLRLKKEKQGLQEYGKWLNTMKKNGPWKDKKKTPVEKVNSVTMPIGEEMTLAITQELLKSGGPMNKALGKFLGPAGIAWDLTGDPGKAW